MLLYVRIYIALVSLSILLYYVFRVHDYEVSIPPIAVFIYFYSISMSEEPRSMAHTIVVYILS